MAGSAVTNLQVLVNTPGVEKLPKLASSLRRLTLSTKEAGLSFTKLSAGLKQQAIDGGKSINNTRSLSNAWKELAASVEFGSKEFREATAEAKRLNAQLVKMEGRKGPSNRMGQAVRNVGAIAGASVFGGLEGGVGATIGAIAGGPGGAIVGGAIGAQVGMLRKSIGSWAEYKAALDKQRLALRLVIKDTATYNKAQGFLLETSRDLAIPQDVIVRQFTSLTASVKGAGLEVNDAEKAFLAIASGIRGTGGSLEDMRAAMTATAQVFSKGKVSAEELRQQLGERLPGAFTIFAESMDMVPADLDKALEQGKVTLEDFMGFVDELTERYKDNAKELAKAPQTAGDRLAQAMSELKDNLSGPIAGIGAMFQDMATTAVTALNKITLETKGYAERLTEETLRNQIDHFRDMVLLYDKEKSLGRDREGWAEGRAMWVQKLATATELYEKFLNKTKDTTGEVSDETETLGKKSNQVWTGMKMGVKEYFNGIKDVTKQIQEATENAFKKMEDSLVDFVTTGKMNFSDFARSVINDLTRIAVRNAMISALSPIPFFGNLFKKNEKGNIYAQNRIVPFAKGGVVTSPHIFPFKNGIGLMSEAGPEAIMPLRRGAGGRLGVEASGGGTSVVVNVDASGSTVEGDAQEARNLGKAISAAVQQELVRQRRPGGILSA